jgi:hypothetical protein
VGGRLVERSNEIYRLFISSARFVVGIGRVTRDGHRPADRVAVVNLIPCSLRIGVS